MTVTDRDRSPPIDRVRLEHLLGMLGSDHAGEVANAARIAEQLRREAGVTWQEILTTPPLPSAPPLPEPVADDREPIDIAGAIELCLENQAHLTRWELGFVRDIAHVRPLSPKQLACLELIARRILTAVKAGACRRAEFEP
jgi:hypothetical protein